MMTTSGAGSPTLQCYVSAWQFEALPFYEAEIYLEQNFIVEKLYGHQLILAVPRYQQNYFFSFIINGDKEYCYGHGEEHE
jgi:hypothetical protein